MQEEEIAYEDLHSLSVADLRSMGFPLGPSKRMAQVRVRVRRQ